MMLQSADPTLIEASLPGAGSSSSMAAVASQPCALRAVIHQYARLAIGGLRRSCAAGIGAGIEVDRVSGGAGSACLTRTSSTSPTRFSQSRGVRLC